MTARRTRVTNACDKRPAKPVHVIYPCVTQIYDICSEPCLTLLCGVAACLQGVGPRSVWQPLDGRFHASALRRWQKSNENWCEICIIVVEISCFIVFAVHALYITPLSVAAAWTFWALKKVITFFFPLQKNFIDHLGALRYSCFRIFQATHACFLRSVWCCCGAFIAYSVVYIVFLWIFHRNLAVFAWYP